MKTKINYKNEINLKSVLIEKESITSRAARMDAVDIAGAMYYTLAGAYTMFGTGAKLGASALMGFKPIANTQEDSISDIFMLEGQAAFETMQMASDVGTYIKNMVYENDNQKHQWGNDIRAYERKLSFDELENFGKESEDFRQSQIAGGNNISLQEAKIHIMTTRGAEVNVI